jgi:small subunit ribosomal protein S2
MTELNIRSMLEAGIHFGHQTKHWHPKMAPYIFGSRQKIHIVNLEKTLQFYKEALNFVSGIIAKKGKVLFVGTKLAARDVIKEEARRAGMPYVDYRWLGGMLTNYKTIKQSIKRLKELEEMRDGPIFQQIPKKETLSVLREIIKLERALGGIRDMGGLPEAVFVIDVGHDKIAVNEARKLKIPIIGVVDTNYSPEGIDYVIPGNDDSSKAIRWYIHNLAEAILAVKATMPEEVAAEKVAIEARKQEQLKKKVVTKKITVTRIKKEEPEIKEEVKKPEIKEEVVAEEKPKKIVVSKIIKSHHETKPKKGEEKTSSEEKGKEEKPKIKTVKKATAKKTTTKKENKGE